MRSHARLSSAAALAALVVLAAPLHAAPGTHASWDRCWADGQVANKAFSCDVNTGSEALILSFESPVASDDRDVLECVLHIMASSPSLPAWWSLFAVGSCRGPVLSVSFALPQPSVCEDHITPQGVGGIVSYEIGPYGPNSVKVFMAAAVPTPEVIPIGPGRETFAMRVNLGHLRTVGTGACEGCLTPVCLGFGSVRARGPAGSADVVITAGSPNTGGGPGNVTWQGAYVNEYTSLIISQVFPTVSFDCRSNAPVPVRRSTWGAVKSLYR